MLRAVLLGLLSLSAVGCKSHETSQAKSQPGVAAGKVIDVVGTVTLHHGPETRPLAKGDPVDADDVVETGADGSVVIELSHNNVDWELAANKKGKLRESLAWSEPKKDKSAKAAEEDSAAAGRHAERSAADNSATAAETTRDQEKVEAKQEESARADEAPRAEAAAAPQAQAVATPQAPPPPPAKPAVSVASPPKAVATAPKAATASKGAPPSPPKAAATMAPKDDADFGGLGLSGAGEGGGGTGDGIGLGGIGTIGHGGGTGQGYGTGAGRMTRSAPTASSLVKAKQPELTKCLKTAKTMRIKIEVDATGKAKVIFLDKIDAQDQACVKKIIDAITFPNQKSAVSISLKA